MAARLGRAFVPLGLVFVIHFARLVVGVPGEAGIALAAIVAALATLAYGLRAVQKTLDRPNRAWMSLAMAGSLIPPGFGLYLLAWEGLRRFAPGATPLTIVVATLHVGLGVWVLRSWMKVVEIERLARIMLMNPYQDGEAS
jgi:hypothetical protein